MLNDEDKMFINNGIEHAINQSTTKIQEAVTETIDKRFIAYGFDIKSPIEIQKDMAHLSKMRKLVDSLSNKVVMFFIATIVAVALGIKYVLPVKGNGG